MDLADRLRPYVEQYRVLGEPMVDADPIRVFLIRWMVETGDPIELVAKGFALEPWLVQEILEGSLRRVREPVAEELIARLGMITYAERCGGG